MTPVWITGPVAKEAVEELADGLDVSVVEDKEEDPEEGDEVLSSLSSWTIGSFSVDEYFLMSVTTRPLDPPTWVLN